MKERPILFSAPMVRALLDGSKTQTRRVMKVQPVGVPTVAKLYKNRACTQPVVAAMWDEPAADGSTCCLSPYGVPGDRLWVREKWGYFDPDCSGQTFEDKNDDGVRGGPCKTYHADMMKEGSGLREYWLRRVAYAKSWKDHKYGNGPEEPKRWRPSIFMPRWASRITLEVTDVRVERLQDISEEDAKAEGVAQWAAGALSPDGQEIPPYYQYEMLWSQINGRSSWDANPFVWVVEFKVLDNPAR